MCTNTSLEPDPSYVSSYPRPVIEQIIIQQNLDRIQESYPTLVQFAEVIGFVAAIIGITASPEEQIDQYNGALRRIQNGEECSFQFPTTHEVALRFCQRFLSIVNRKRPA